MDAEQGMQQASVSANEGRESAGRLGTELSAVKPAGWGGGLNSSTPCHRAAGSPSPGGGFRPHPVEGGEAGPV